MTTNDTLVLHLIKHLVRKSEETNLAELLEETHLPTIGKETTDIQTKLAHRLLGQLSKIEDSLTGLRQQVQAWVSPNLTTNLLQSVAAPKNGTATAIATPAVKAIPDSQYPTWLLQPLQGLQRLLSNSAFVYSQPYTTSYCVETKEKNIYFYAFVLPEAAPTGELLSFLHHQLNKFLFVETQVDLIDVVANLDKAIMMHASELPYLAQASQVKFVIGKIDKAQAILQCLHSGLAVHYTQASALHAIPFQHITLGQRENTAPQVHTIPIKRNTQFHITTSLDKITIEEFAKNSPALPAKQQTDWLANKIRETKDAPAMLLSFGF